MGKLYPSIIYKFLACFLAIFILFSLFPATASRAAGTMSAVYLKTNGTGDGTQSSPVGTFAAAKNLLAPDGTIYLDMSSGYIANSGAETWSLPSSEYGNAKVVVLPDTLKATYKYIITVKRDGSATQTYPLTLQDITIDISNISKTGTAAGLVSLFDMTQKGATLVIGFGATIICPDGIACVYDSRPNAGENRSVTIATDANITGAVTKTETSQLTITDNRIPTTYPVTVGSLSNGTVTADPASAATGDTVTLTVAPSEGYRLTADSLTATKAGGGTVAVTEQANGTYTFTMPAEAVTVAAEFEEAATYPVTVGSLTNGAVTADPTSAAAGDTVTLTVAPSEGYQLTADSLTVTKAGGGTVEVTQGADSTFTFIMPAEAVTVTAEFTVPFTVAAPTFSVTAGTVAVNTQVTISTTTEGASIYYTTDGTVPSATNGTLYSGPVSITADTTLKAVAVLDGYPASAVATAVYTVATEKYDITFYYQNYTYSLWVDHTALAEGLVKSGSGSKTYYEAASPGQTVEFTVAPLDGYEITQLYVRWTLYMESGPLETTYDQITGRYSFTMPVGWVSIQPNTSAVKRVTVAEGITGGTVTTDAATTSGSVTVTAAPDQGNHLKSIAYSYDGETWTKVASGQLTFTPTADVTVKAEFAEGVDISISSAEQLAAFAAAVNAGDAYIGATLTLTDDIALTGEWTPIGADFPFAGTFDGNYKTVSGLLITQGSWTYAGLFGSCGAGTIQNLTVSGTISSPGADGSNTMYVGGVAGSAGTLTNCTSVVDISMGRGWVGGVAGTAASVTGCKNYGTLTVAVSGGHEALAVGGILGTMSSAVGSLARCANYGGITFDGGVYSVTDSQTGATTTGDAASGYFGGLVGSTQVQEITDSANKGTISGDMRTAGGLVGESDAALTLTNCYNTGAVTETGDYLNQSRVRLGGLVGSSYYNRYNLTLNNCYSTGAVTVQQPTSRAAVGELHCNAIDNGAHGGGTATTTVNNSFGPSSLSSITAAQLGSAFKEDAQNVNGGYPLLTWEDSEPNDEAYAVTFSVTPANAEITVYSDAGRTQQVEKGADGYMLPTGTYYYKVTAEGYGAETGSFSVSIRPVTVTIALRQVATVTFHITPPDANFRLTDSSGVEITPTSSTGGVYPFDLYVGNVYIYTVTKDGYNGVTREYTAVNNASVTVTLTPSGQSPDNPTITGGQTISAGGVYNLGRVSGASQGVITISTSDPVTLVGTGTSLADAYENLYIDCTVEGVNLTLQDLYISNNVGVTNMIDFMGADNYLYFAGTSILDMNTGATGYAMIHVNSSTSLTVGGVTPDDTLYFYKREQGAGIGGNGGASGSEGQAPEYNGAITITDGNLFMKNSKQGALIGSGANAKSTQFTPGPITIEGGVLNLIPISRGAAIGGSAGSTGGAAGTNVYIYPEASVNINVDYSGSAIGGGGFAQGNDSDGGILHYTGGSIRTFIDHNAAAENLWPGVTEAGVNDVAITADKVNADGANVYLLTFDTNRLSDQADSYTVEEGGAVIYSGGLHAWRYINEDLYKTDQIAVNYTIDNWAPLDDPNLYLYLTGEDHTLTVNGEDFDIRWNSETSAFTFGDGSPAPATPSISAQPAGATYTVGNTAAALSVTASVTDGGELSYQWYSSADNTATTPSDDTAVGTGSDTYTPPTTIAGTTWYYCVVTNTLDGRTATATSDVAAVVVEAAGPGVLTPPVLTPDTTANTVGEAVDITFPTDAAWEAAISGITVNTVSLDGEQYTVNPGNINLAANVFNTPGDYSIAVTATGYSDAAVTQTIQEANTPENYTVTFVSDGTTYTTVSAASGVAIEAPAAPAKEGHVFGGWYTDETWTTAVGFPYTVTSDVTFYARWTAAPADSPRYTITPVVDESVYEVGESGGISTMTVKDGVNGLKYFGTQVAPVIEHEGREAVVFVHLRGGVQLSINVTRADFDLLDEAQAGFNVQAGDVVRVYIVDDLTNDVGSNPTVLQ